MPGAVIVPSDPITLLFPGNSGWKQSGTPRWQRNMWELDRLVVPCSGSLVTREAFIDTLPDFGSWSDDANMFLESYPQDDKKVFPTLNLNFLGKRNGVLPPPRNLTTSTIQETTGIVFSDAFILTFGLPPHWQTTIRYISQTWRYVVWTRTPPNFNAITPPVITTLGASDIVSIVANGIDYTVWQAVQGIYLTYIVPFVLSWFYQRNATYTQSDEMVPSQYFRATVTQQSLLLPAQESIVS